MILRRLPTDFVVLEHLRPGVLAQAGTQVVYRLTKSSLTTTDAVGRLARALGVRPNQIEYAGLKDKHALTTQHVSVAADALRGVSTPQGVSQPVSEVASRPTSSTASLASSHSAPQAAVGADQWQAEVAGFCDRPLAAGAIMCNEFTITLRGIDERESRAIDDAAARLSIDTSPTTAAATSPRSLLVLNLFGSQRFVSARHGQGFAARALMAGDFNLALKLLIASPARKDTGQWRAFTRAAALHWGNWSEMLPLLASLPHRRAIETLAHGGDARSAFATLPAHDQQMCVEAYQSYLWNIAAGRFAEQVRSGDGRVDPVWSEVEMAMLAPDTVLREPWRGAAEAALDAENIELAQLTIPGLRRPAFRSAMRRLFVCVDGFTASPAERDELAAAASTKPLKRTIAFRLPAGAYATVVVAALGEASGEPGDED